MGMEYKIVLHLLIVSFALMKEIESQRCVEKRGSFPKCGLNLRTKTNFSLLPKNRIGMTKSEKFVGSYYKSYAIIDVIIKTLGADSTLQCQTKRGLVEVPIACLQDITIAISPRFKEVTNINMFKKNVPRRLRKRYPKMNIKIKKEYVNNNANDIACAVLSNKHYRRLEKLYSNLRKKSYGKRNRRGNKAVHT